MVEVFVEDIAISGDDSQFLVLLRSDQDDILPMVIDGVQAYAISMGRSGEKASRPLSHDLMLSMMEMLGAKIARIEITDLIEGIYFAMVVLERSGIHLEVDARPSDALALAVRVDAPVFVAEHVLEQNALTDDLSSGSEGFEA